MRAAFKPTKVRSATMELIGHSQDVVTDYRKQGLKLSLRQLYYQLVTKNLITNEEKSYRRLGTAISTGRLAGLIDWDAIEDRGRVPKRHPEWNSVKGIVESALHSYRLPRLAGQENYVELWCFPAVTPVVTEDGVHDISSVTVGDRVLTGKGKFGEVVDVMSRATDDELVEIKALGLLPVQCTGEHPVFADLWDASKSSYKGAKRKYLARSYFQADTLKKYDRLLVPRIKLEEDFDGVTMVGTERCSGIEVTLDTYFCEMIGAYASDGNVRSDGRTVQFTFGAERNEELADSVEHWASRYGIGTTRNYGPGTIIVYAFSKVFASWVMQFMGSGAFDKRLPNWALFLPHEKQHSIMRAYHRCDGTKPSCSERRVSVTTRSRSLAIQSQIILGRLGFGAAISSRIEMDQSMYRVGVSGEYGAALARKWGLPKIEGRTFNHIRVEDDFVSYPVHSVTSVSGSSRQVYNLSVAGDKSYCVPFVVHNCEKEALAGVLEPLANRYHIVLMVNKGYSSQSAMYQAARRIDEHCRSHKRNKEGEVISSPVVLYLGDFDPSGEDMVRDISDRLNMFLQGYTVDSDEDVEDIPYETVSPAGWNAGYCGTVKVEVEKIAITPDQIQQYNPPPNPTKLSDSRAKAFIAEHGANSWEVDALSPPVLGQIVTDAVEQYIDKDKMNAIIDQETKDKELLREAVEVIMERQSMNSLIT